MSGIEFFGRNIANRKVKTLILGRGIHADGTLTSTGKERAEIAVEIGRMLDVAMIVWSGGRSWRQAKAGVLPPSEGGAGMEHALAYGGKPSEGRIYACEEESESTVANMVNSAPILDMQPGETLVVMSDETHFAYGRPQYLAGLVYPDNDVVSIQIPRIMTPADLREERRTTLVTKVAMAGVRKGDLDAIMRRQRVIEKSNSLLHSVVGLAGRPGELDITPPTNDFSYHQVPNFQDMHPSALARVLVEQAA